MPLIVFVRLLLFGDVGDKRSLGGARLQAPPCPPVSHERAGAEQRPVRQSCAVLLIYTTDNVFSLNSRMVMTAALWSRAGDLWS
jgi:hypothetical protein